MTVGIAYSIPLVVFMTALVGCAEVKSGSENKKWFNEEAFVGLESLGSSYQAIRLAYDLDGAEGDLIGFDNCDEVENTEESDIVQSQFPLYRKLYINCLAAKYYYEGSSAESDFLPKDFNAELVDQLPASVVPNRGGSSLEVDTGQILGERKSFEAIEASGKVLTVKMESTEIDYVLLAEVDVNSDGLQDWLLRIDWSDTESFGSGTDLVILTQKSKRGEIEVVKRYP